MQKERFLAESRADRAYLWPARPSALQAELLGWRNDALPERTRSGEQMKIVWKK